MDNKDENIVMYNKDENLEKRIITLEKRIITLEKSNNILKSKVRVSETLVKLIQCLNTWASTAYEDVYKDT